MALTSPFCVLFSPQRARGPQFVVFLAGTGWPAGRQLLTLDFADLKAGDAVVVFGRLNDSGAMDGLALIADFGWFETTPQNSSHVVAWRLRSMNLDIP